MKSRMAVAISIIASVVSLLSTAFFGYGYYKHVYLVELYMPKPMPRMPLHYMADAPMWTNGLWSSTVLTIILAVTLVVLSVLIRRKN